jgi:putative Mg2+ transporter-C (MgtC) family protein
MWIKDIFFDEVCQKLLLSFLLGGILGLERQRHGRAAGLRTHILVCLASTLLMIAPAYIMRSIASCGTSFNIDPLRVGAGIMTGMGFIGAGTIVRSHNFVRGLTTAACVWLTAAIGIIIGLGIFKLALVATLLSFFVLLALGKVDAFLRIENFRVLTVYTKSSHYELPAIKKICRDMGARILDISMMKDKTVSKTVYKIHLKFPYRIKSEKLIDQILSFSSVERVSWKSY